MTNDARIESLLLALKKMGVSYDPLRQQISDANARIVEQARTIPTLANQYNVKPYPVDPGVSRQLIDSNRMAALLSQYRDPELYVPGEYTGTQDVTDWFSSDAAKNWLSQYLWGAEAHPQAVYKPEFRESSWLQSAQMMGQAPSDMTHDNYITNSINSGMSGASSAMKENAQNILARAAAEAFGQGKHRNSVTADERKSMESWAKANNQQMLSYNDYLSQTLDSVSVQGNDGKTYAGKTLFKELIKEQGDNGFSQAYDIIRQADKNYGDYEKSFRDAANQQLTFSNQSLQQSQLANDTNPALRSQAASSQGAPTAGNTGWGSVGYGYGPKTSQESLRERREGWGQNAGYVGV